MSVQWFPGHMTAARKRSAELMAHTDVVIEVVDARIPEASCNPMVHALRRARQRSCLKLLNKADLADPAVTAQWLDYFNAQEGVKAVALSCKKPADVARVQGLAQSLAPHRNDGTKRLRLMVMGIPNVGKSTLINALLKRRVAAVGDEPAVTKSTSTYDLGPLATLTDTPGLMWPKIEFDSDGYMLAASHAIGVNAVNEEEVACFLADCLRARYPESLAARYNITDASLDGPSIVEAVALRRGCRVKGGGLDLEKAALILLGDYRSGALGRVSLESPTSRGAMVMAHKAALSAKTAPKAPPVSDAEAPG